MSEDQTGIDPLTGLPKGFSIAPTETSVDLTRLIIVPQAFANKPHITKDLAITNLDRSEINFLFHNLELIHILQYIAKKTKWDLEELIEIIVNSDVQGYSQITRSKNGFERLAEITKKLSSIQTFEEKTKKGLF